VNLLAQERKVCILSPHWPGFDAICAANNVQAVHVRSTLESNWAWDAADLDAAIDADTKLVVICNPNNPTSTVLSGNKVNELAGVASEHGVQVLVDTAYQGLSFSKMDGQIRPSENVIVAGSFSKGFAMTGWRAGYLESSPEFAQRMVSLAQSTFSCVPQFVQDAAICAMHNPQIEDVMAKEYEERAKIACDVLSKKFEFAKPQAGIYIFVTKAGLDGDRACMELLKSGIGVAPGSAFGFPGFLRISLTLPQDELACALEKINRLV
jgi:aspartate/methionine/tyrosine aminotransferase